MKVLNNSSELWQSYQRVFVVNVSKAKELIDWEIKVAKEEGIRKIIECVKNG